MPTNDTSSKITGLFASVTAGTAEEQGIALSDVVFTSYAIQGREGVSLHVLYGDRGAAAGEGSLAALVRYEAGARTPRHLHPGNELILVLDGELIDDTGQHRAGSLNIHRAGSHHQLGSEKGCTLLVVWEKPVVSHSIPADG